MAQALPIRRAGSAFHGRTFQRTCGRFWGFLPSRPPRRCRVTCSFPPTAVTGRRVPRPGRAGSPDCPPISALITRRGAFPAAPTTTSPLSRARRDTRHQEQENCRPISALITPHGVRHVVANRRIRILTVSGAMGGCFNGRRIPLHRRHDRLRLIARARRHYGRAVPFRSASSVNCLIRNRSERIHDSSVSPRNVNSRSNRCLPFSTSTTSAFIHWINVLSLWIPP